MASLTVNFPLQLESAKFSNGETAKKAQGYNTITFTSSVTISSVALASGYLSWSGTLYWGKTDGAKTWKFATVRNGSVTILTHEQIDCTGNRTIYITAEAGSVSYTTHPIYFRVGTGVASYRMQYANATYTGLLSDYINSDYQSTVLSVRDGTNASLYGLNYDSGYGEPWQFVEYTNSAFATVKKHFSEGDGYVLSNGVRYIALTATPLAYWYRVRAWGNGGTFTNQSGADNYYTALASSTTTSVIFNVGTLETPYRAGYTFLGWGYTSNATTYYKDQTIPISATSQSSSSPTIINLYAIWTKTEYDAYIRMGAGISSMAVYVDGALKSQISDTAYHKLTVNLESSIVMKSIAKKTGYEKPYTVNFYISATSTTPNTSLESSSDEVEYLYYSHHKYAELTAKKANIDLFYWQNATWDAANIKAGQPISNLTATRWNNLLAKIKELADAEGDSYSYTGVSSGASILATTFNGARTAISNRTGHGTLPSTQAKNDPVKAALFEGTGSLKSALNAAITHYNNS